MNSENKVLFILPAFITYEIILGTKSHLFTVPRIPSAYGSFHVYEWNNRRVRITLDHRRGKDRFAPRLIISRP